MRRALVAVVATGSFLVAAIPASAVFPGQNGRIVYTTGQGASYRIHTVLPSGTGDAVIAHTGSGFSWSPNGRRLAFTGQGSNLYTMRSDGTDLRKLTSDGNDLAPHYSPGGDQIVFTHVGSSAAFITAIRTDGSHRRTLGRGAATAWAPTGEIAYIATRPGDSQTFIWAMRPDGSQKRRLVGLGEFGGYGPMYSPDATRFLFVRFGGNAFNQQVFLANADGSAVHRPPCTPFAPLSYSPDGNWILGNTKQNNQGTASLIRVSAAAPCTRLTVASAVNPGEADWQSHAP